MDTDEFLDNYKNSLDDYVQGYGHKEGIKRFVKHFSNDELVQNIKEQEDDDLGGALSGLTEKEYIPIRNKVFDTAFGKGFVEQYEKHPFVGQGGFGTVFEKPGDPSRVIKVQRLDSDSARTRADEEVEAQLKAAELGLAPRIHTVETGPSSHEPSNSNKMSSLHSIEMDRVSTMENPDHNFIFGTPEARGSREQALALAKSQLKLASATGIVHDDIVTPYGKREDHMYYDPEAKTMGFVDYGKINQYDHAEDLHNHDEYGPNFNKATDRAKHFLDHQVNAIYDGMYAVGNVEEGEIFKATYKELRDNNNMRDASNLVDQGASLVQRHTMEDIPETSNNPTAREVLETAQGMSKIEQQREADNRFREELYKRYPGLLES